MRPEAQKLLWDAVQAAANIEEFTAGRSLEDYAGSVILRSAVERQLEIIGEACNQLSRVDPETANRIPDLGKIVSFRNVLAHDYASVDDRLVWEIVEGKLPGFAALARRLLEERAE
jgi:uncharacterized protein with HEPN domain